MTNNLRIIKAPRDTDNRDLDEQIQYQEARLEAFKVAREKLKERDREIATHLRIALGVIETIRTQPTSHYNPQRCEKLQKLLNERVIPLLEEGR